MLNYIIMILAFMAPTKKDTIIEKLENKVIEYKLENKKIVLFVDYSISISKKRFFVYDTKKKKVLYSDYVGHAARSGKYRPVRTSNEPGSLKTSLGVYKVGRKYKGSFGESFKLKGLSETNSNAYKRYIIVHTIYRPNSFMFFGEDGEARMIGPEENKRRYLYSHGCFVFYQETYPDIQKYMKKGRVLVAFK